MLHLTDDLETVSSILVFGYGLCHLLHLLACNSTAAVGDAFQTGDFESLALLDDFHKHRSLRERVVCPRVKPGETAPKSQHLQTSCLQEMLVDRGKLPIRFLS